MGFVDNNTHFNTGYKANMFLFLPNQNNDGCRFRYPTNVENVYF